MSNQSVQSDVLDLVVATLGGEAQGAFRCRFSPFAVKELPADNVIPDDETPEYEDASGVELKFRFKLRHTAAAADQVDKVVDLRYVRAAKLLQSSTLGGQVRYVRYIGRKWEFEQGLFDTVALVVTYETEFSTNRRDPSVAGY